MRPLLGDVAQAEANLRGRLREMAVGPNEVLAKQALHRLVRPPGKPFFGAVVLYSKISWKAPMV